MNLEVAADHGQYRAKRDGLVLLNHGSQDLRKYLSPWEVARLVRRICS